MSLRRFSVIDVERNNYTFLAKDVCSLSFISIKSDCFVIDEFKIFLSFQSEDDIYNSELSNRSQNNY